jgi:hypothetical protein
MSKLAQVEPIITITASSRSNLQSLRLLLIQGLNDVVNRHGYIGDIKFNCKGRVMNINTC